MKEEDIIRAAKMVGDFGHAEHYLNSLLMHALMYDKKYLIEKVNDIRRHYNAFVYEPTVTAPASSNNMPGYGSASDKTAELLRKNYQQMQEYERSKFLKDCLQLLRASEPTLFNKQNCWIGLYMVVRDRLDGRLSKTDYTRMAKSATPEDWPEKLKISDNTITNFARYVDYEDRDLAYYEMNRNPWENLCSAFWSIIKQQFLTRI